MYSQRKRILSLAAALSLTALAATLAGATEPPATLRIESVRKEIPRLVVRAAVGNDGASAHEFVVGCSLMHRDRLWEDVPSQRLRVPAGEVARVEFAPEVGNLGDYVKLRVTLWAGAADDGRPRDRLAHAERNLY